MVKPSAIHSKLVLGYLVQLKCFETARTFVKESNHFNGEEELLHDLNEENSAEIDVLGESLIEIVESYTKFKKVMKLSIPNPYLSTLSGILDKNAFSNTEISSCHVIPEHHRYLGRKTDNNFQSNSANPSSHSETSNSQSNQHLDEITEPNSNAVSSNESSESVILNAESIPEEIQNDDSVQQVINHGSDRPDVQTADSNHMDISNTNFIQIETPNIDSNQVAIYPEENIQSESTSNPNSNQQNADQPTETLRNPPGQIIVPKLPPHYLEETDGWPIANGPVENVQQPKSREATGLHEASPRLNCSNLISCGKVVARVDFSKRLNSTARLRCNKRTYKSSKESNTTKNNLDKIDTPHHIVVVNSSEPVTQHVKIRKMNLRNYAEKC